MHAYQRDRAVNPCVGVAIDHALGGSRAAAVVLYVTMFVELLHYFGSFGKGSTHLHLWARVALGVGVVAICTGCRADRALQGALRQAWSNVSCQWECI